MTNQLVQPRPANPIWRWLRGKIVGNAQFAFNHPIEAAFLAFALWITLTGLMEANWAAVPQNGIAQTVIAGEARAFQETVGVHTPALTDWAGHLTADTIDTTSYIAAAFVARFMNYLMRDLNRAPATISPGK